MRLRLYSAPALIRSNPRLNSRRLGCGGFIRRLRKFSDSLWITLGARACARDFLMVKPLKGSGRSTNGRANPASNAAPGSAVRNMAVAQRIGVRSVREGERERSVELNRSRVRSEAHFRASGGRDRNIFHSHPPSVRRKAALLFSPGFSRGRGRTLILTRLQPGEEASCESSVTVLTVSLFQRFAIPTLIYASFSAT